MPMRLNASTYSMEQQFINAKKNMYIKFKGAKELSRFLTLLHLHLLTVLAVQGQTSSHKVKKKFMTIDRKGKYY